MTIPKLIVATSKKAFLDRCPKLAKITSSKLTKNTCITVDFNVSNVVLPVVNSNGILRLSENDFFCVLYPILQQFFYKLKKERDIKRGVKILHDQLRRLSLTKEEILLFSAKFLVILAVCNIRIRGGH